MTNQPGIGIKEIPDAGKSAAQPLIEPTSVSLARDHLFINYATEDWALSEWLSLKLLAEGYRVWCDRLKLLGGESYPRDIDVAIKNRTFRVLSLLSHASLQKPNPTKERTLAINIARERKIDFVIPLNVSGLKPTELDWHTNDLSFIPFQDWAAGLSQLLKKLKEIEAPKTQPDPRAVAASFYLPKQVVKSASETLSANCLRVKKIPDVLHRVRSNRSLTDDELRNLSAVWPFYKLSAADFLAFHTPPKNPPGGIRLTKAGGAMWRIKPEMDGVSTRNVVTNLLARALQTRCQEKGMRLTLDGTTLYFEKGKLPKDEIQFLGYNGAKTHVRVVGERSVRVGEERRKYWYFVCPSFRVRRDILDDYGVILRISVDVADPSGRDLPARTALSRRKKVTKSWWNHEWFNRHLAFCSLLSDGGDDIVIGSDAESLVISSKMHTLESPLAIDEDAIEGLKPPAEPEEPSAEDVDEEPAGDDDGE